MHFCYGKMNSSDKIYFLKVLATILSAFGNAVKGNRLKKFVRINIDAFT